MVSNEDLFELNAICFRAVLLKLLFIFLSYIAFCNYSVSVLQDDASFGTLMLKGNLEFLILLLFLQKCFRLPLWYNDSL